MTNFSEMGDAETAFLISLYQETGGDVSKQVSMHEIGRRIGLDRDASGRNAESLIGEGYVEVRTLSGGIGITESGAAAALELGAGTGTVDEELKNAPVIDEEDRRRIDRVTTDLKTRAGGLNLDFDSLSELTADLKTLDAQAASPVPKTEIIRACFRSVRNNLERNGAAADIASPVKRLLGES